MSEKFFSKDDIDKIAARAHEIAVEYTRTEPGILIRHREDFRATALVHLAIECAIADIQPRRSGPGDKPG